MSPSPTRRRRALAAATAAALAAATLALAGAPAGAAKPAGHPAPAKANAGKPSKPAKPSKPGKPGKPSAPGQQPILLDLLALNDFHGQLEKLDGGQTSSGRVETPTGRVNSGGAAYLGTHLDRLRAESKRRGAHSVTVAAGDLIGATPLLSAAFHDEPTIEAMNLLGLDVASVGNHEFDEGYRELLRMQQGGCLPDGDGKDNQNSCPDGEFEGADYQYLSANVRYAGTDRTVLPEYAIKKVGRAKVAFVGMTLEDTPNIVTKAGVEGLEFDDEVETANRLVPELRAQGVRSIVVLLHEGGTPSDAKQYNGCVGVTGPGRTIAEQLHPAIDVVVSGHTHQAYNCVVDDPAGNKRLFTSASSLGRIVTEVNLQIDPRSKDIVRPRATATNHIVTNGSDVAQRGDIVGLIERYLTLVQPIANEVVGHLAPEGSRNDLSRTADPDGRDSPLGNLIADSMVADPSTVVNGQTPTIALMNPGGIRSDLVENAAGDVTYGAAFAVQPFNNYLVSETLTGQQLLDALEQQWNDRNESADGSAFKILQVAGLSYSWSLTEAQKNGAPAIVPGSVQVDTDGDGTTDAPLDPGASYRVVVNSFLADGGDGFPALNGADKFYGGLDIDALTAYLGDNDPYEPEPTTRITMTP